MATDSVATLDDTAARLHLSPISSTKPRIVDVQSLMRRLKQL